jgi:hypothetical protein
MIVGHEITNFNFQDAAWFKIILPADYKGRVIFSSTVQPLQGSIRLMGRLNKRMFYSAKQLFSNFLWRKKHCKDHITKFSRNENLDP